MPENTNVEKVIKDDIQVQLDIPAEEQNESIADTSEGFELDDNDDNKEDTAETANQESLDQIDDEQSDDQMVELNDFLNQCLLCQMGQITKLQLIDWLNKNVKIRFYLPLVEKTLIISEYLFLREGFENDIAWIIKESEEWKLWCVVLKYTNIQCNLDDPRINTLNYDLIMEYTYDWLFPRIVLDYTKTIDMINDAINYSNIVNMIESWSKYADPSKLSKELENMDQDFEKIDKYQDVIDILKNNKEN